MESSADLFSSCPERRGTASFKWDFRFGPDVLPMWVADMDFAAPPAVTAALSARAAHGIFGYSGDTAALRATVVAWLRRRHGWDGVAPESVVFTPGIVCGVNVFLRAAGAAAALCNVPAYPPFLSAPQNHGVRLVTVPLTEPASASASSSDGCWRFDVSALEKAAADAVATTGKAPVFILCHPHNPTGRVWTVAELEEVADVCERHGMLVFSDEIWADLVLDGVHVPFAKAVPRLAQRTVTMMAPSKTFNVPGLGCSVAIVPNADLRKKFEAAANGIVPHVGCFGLVGCEAAWGGASDAWLDNGLLPQLRRNRDAVVETLRKMPRLRWWAPQATYLFWIDARNALPNGMSATSGIAQWLADTHKLGLNDGVDFAAPGWLRINFGCPPAMLAEGLKRFEAAFSQ